MVMKMPNGNQSNTTVVPEWSSVGSLPHIGTSIRTHVSFRIPATTSNRLQCERECDLSHNNESHNGSLTVLC